MIKLPRALAPWAAQLSLFPEDLALILGQQVSQIANLVGGWRQDSAQEGTPDGYDGAAMRGTYDRLLMSEWLLLDEAPEEFLRRAISGEHAFLRRAWRDDTAAKRCVALFDSGPEQLGAPRIVQLAVAIVLAQRAEKHGASFELHALQGSGPARAPSTLSDQLGDLMKSRCARRAASHDVVRWISVLSSAAISELWLVGAPRLRDEAQRIDASSLVIADLLEPGAPRRLHVSVLTPHTGQSRAATLEAPEGPAAAQLLRGPQAQRVTPQRAPAEMAATKISAKSNIVFGMGGKLLWVRSADGGLTTFHIPNSRNERCSPPQTFTPPHGKTVVAVSPKKWGRHIVVALEGPDGLEVCTLTKRTREIYETQASASYKNGERPAWSNSALLYPLYIFSQHRYYFYDSSTQVEINKGNLMLSADRIFIASTTDSEGQVIAEHTRGVLKIFRNSIKLKNGTQDITKEFSIPNLRSSFQFFFSNAPRDFMVVGRLSEPLCLISCAGDTFSVELPRGYLAVGMIAYGHPRAAAAVIMDEARSRIELLWRDKRETLCTSPIPIAYVGVSDAAPAIAYITENSELGVFQYSSSRGLACVARWTAPQ